MLKTILKKFGIPAFRDTGCLPISSGKSTLWSNRLQKDNSAWYVHS